MSKEGRPGLRMKFERERRKGSQWLASRELKIKIGGMPVPPNKQGSFKLQSHSIFKLLRSKCNKKEVNKTAKDFFSLYFSSIFL